MICGKPIPTWNGGLIEQLKERTAGRVLNRGISIACGDGRKEMALLRAGLVRSFDLFEISQTRVATGVEIYEKAKLSHLVNWHLSDGVEHLERCPDSYDLVFWDNALHHMPDTARAVSASRVALRQSGLFAMNDFVGPSRFQWSDRALHFANMTRSKLPEKFLRSIHSHGRSIPRTILRPTIEAMLAADPSEAADSSSIIPALKKFFPDASLWPLGGTIYHLAMNDVLSNTDDITDAATIEALLILEVALIELGEHHYAACIASAT